MDFNVEEFLICDKGERNIYSKTFGYVTVKCYPRKVDVACNFRTTIDGRFTPSPYNDTVVKVKVEDLYLARVKTYDKYGSTKWQYEPFSFSRYAEEQGFVVAIKNGEFYYRVTGGFFNGEVTIETSICYDTISSVFGVGRSITTRQGRQVYSVKFDKFVSALKGSEFKKADDFVLAEVENVNELKPKTKVFADFKGGGEGEIVRLKEFSVSSKKAVYDVKLNSGEIVEYNLYDDKKVDANGQVKNIGSGIKVFKKAGERTKDELEELKVGIKEELLNPFVRGKLSGFNLFWQSVEDAIYYTVELYAYNSQSIGNKLYKMMAKTIDRNVFYFDIDGLAVGSYIVRVLAESREGEIVAQNESIFLDVTTGGTRVLSKW